MLRMVLAEVPSTTPPLLELRKWRVGGRSGEEGGVGGEKRKEKNGEEEKKKRSGRRVQGAIQYLDMEGGGNVDKEGYREHQREGLSRAC